MSKKRKIFNIIAAVLKYVILIFGALFTLMPFLWMIISSLKTPAEIIAIPPTLLPSSPQWSNYTEAWSAAPFPRYFLNTIIVTIFSTIGVLATAILSAFAFSRLNFPGWNSFLWPLLVTNDKNMRVISNGLVRFQTEAGSDYQLIMAASTIMVMPIVIVYLFLRKYIIEGVTQSGLKS